MCLSALGGPEEHAVVSLPADSISIADFYFNPNGQMKHLIKVLDYSEIIAAGDKKAIKPLVLECQSDPFFFIKNYLSESLSLN